MQMLWRLVLQAREKQQDRGFLTHVKSQDRERVCNVDPSSKADGLLWINEVIPTCSQMLSNPRRGSRDAPIAGCRTVCESADREAQMVAYKAESKWGPSLSPCWRSRRESDYSRDWTLRTLSGGSG